MDVRSFVNGKLQGPQVSGENDKENQDANIQVSAAAKAAPSLEAVVASRPFLMLSLPNCPQCEELATFLAARGVPADAITVKWDKASDDYAALKKQLQVHAGEVFTFPQVFAAGEYEGGFQEVMAKAERGVYDDLFEREFDIEPKTLQKVIERRPMVVFSLPNCPNCEVLYEDLKKRGLPVQDVFEKLDKARPEYQALKAQMQRLIGKQQFAFPQTFVQGVYQGDFDEVIAKADQGAFADFFSEQFGLEPPKKEEAPPPAGAIGFDEDF